MLRFTLMAALFASTLAVQAADGALRADLERIAHAPIYFGHQSVGANILEGVRQLADGAGVPLHIAHGFLAENGEPLRKLASFKSALGEGSHVDIALMKFCYVDVNSDTDASALFERYRTAIAELRAKNPRTTFVHVTLPLTTAQTGWKALAKRMLGRAPYGTIENLRREEYNTLLRRAFRGREPIFDLARVESTAPDGTTASVNWNGTSAPVMVAAYTDDGGHLNAKGKLLAARELIAVLAAATKPLQKIDDFATPVRMPR
jgi:hypothetical protein